MSQLTPLTNEIRANTVTAGDQYDAVVAPLSTGGFVVVWDNAGAAAGIVGQRFSAAGTPVGAEFTANGPFSGTRVLPAVAGLANGGFVVAWEDGGFSAREITARRFDAAGNPTGNEFQVNTIFSGSQIDAHITALEGGGFVVIWDTFFNSTFQDVSGQIYDAAGATVGKEFVLNATTVRAQALSSLAPLPGGGFVAVWLSNVNPADENSEIIGQRFNATGARVGAEFQVNITTAGNQFGEDVAVLPGGGFVVSWLASDPVNPGIGQILARRYDPAGNAIGGEIIVRSSTKGLGGTSATALPDGRFVIGWTELTAPGSVNSTIQARSYMNDGTPFDLPIELNGAGGAFRSLMPDGLATLGENSIAVAWDFTNPAPSGNSDIFFRRWQVPSAPLPGDDVIGSPPGGSTRSGGDGNDSMYGNVGVEHFFGDDGNDLILGGGGNDVLAGGNGDDLIGGGGSGAPNDGEDWLEGGAGNDWLSGGDGNDHLEGGIGNDVLEGQSGVDAMFGGAGNDVYFVDNALDDVFENPGEGTDIVFASVSYANRANVEVLVLTGAAAINATGSDASEALAGNDAANSLGGFGGNDWLEGRGGNDWISGGAGNDRLEGGDGNDTLEGQFGVDLMIGGAGADSFLFTSIHDSSTADGVDSIAGFEHGIDRIVIASQGATPGIGLVFSSGNTIASLDVDGNGTIDMTMVLLGVTNVTASDFVFG